MNDIVYYLALEQRPGDYKIIDINSLNLVNYYISNSLNAIDNFTVRFSTDDIKNAIKKSNIEVGTYIYGTLKVISNKKHNFKIIDKDIFEVIRAFQYSKEPISNELKNIIYGLFRKIIDNEFEENLFKKGMLTKFKDAIDLNDKEKMFKIMEELPYVRSRTIYLGIYETISKDL